MSRINRIIIIFLFFLIAPFLPLFMISHNFSTHSVALAVPLEVLDQEITSLQEETYLLQDRVLELGVNAAEQEETFRNQEESLSVISQTSTIHRKLSDDIYEQKILDMLGPAVAAQITDRTEIKIFKLAELGYRGYIAKVKLFDPSAFKVILAQDSLGELETTSAAAKRSSAILAINGGGFYTERRNGQSYAQMIGNTVINGSLVEPFNGYPGNLFFAGVNKKGQVIGTVPKTETELMALNPYQGVSFIPVLLKNGQKLEIPADWKTTRQPRTIIGKYANDDLIMIVIDGRQNDWSVGVTLETLQDKLLELGVKEAYNLDGGGSSAMYYNGQILNQPSEGKERPVVNNIVIMP